MHILVVEAHERLGKPLEQGLKSEGYLVDLATGIGGGLEFLKLFHSDFIIIDQVLQHESVTRFLKQLRQQGKTMPILVLSADADLEEKLECFRAGADDYIVKPVAVSEIAARIQAILRRGPILIESILRIGNLELHRLKRQVTVDGRRLDLSSKQYSLLEYILLHPDRILTRDQMLQQLWHSSFNGASNIVDVYIGQLRQKILKRGGPNVVRTVRGMGYILDSMERPLEG